MEVISESQWFLERSILPLLNLKNDRKNTKKHYLNSWKNIEKVKLKDQKCKLIKNN